MPIILRYYWNGGSILGFVSIIQTISGVILSFFYSVNVKERFYYINFFIDNDVFLGFFVHLLHLSFGRLFFIRIFFHIFRNIIYKSFNKLLTWKSGVFILLILILTAFIGYVLPWGQISFWGARVITTFLRVVPYIGKKILNVLWRSNAIGQTLISFFFSLHFIFPFILIIIIFFHLIFLHINKSRNKLFTMNIKKRRFNNYLLIKDIINFLLIYFFIIIITIFPFIFDDEENSKLANEIVSPTHIKPEWYFLFAYAILRSIPNKIGGVLLMGFRVLFFFLFSYKNNKKIRKNRKKIIIIFFFSCLLLTWIGIKPAEDPYIFNGQILLFFYFLILLI